MMQHRRIDGDPIVISDRASAKQDEAIRMKRFEARCLEAAATHAGDGEPWFAIRVASGHERLVENTLRAAGIEAIAPLRKGRMFRRRGRNVQPLIPVMNGYVLVRFAASAEAFIGVTGMDHVLGFVGGATAPIPISAGNVTEFCHMARNGMFDWLRATTGIRRDMTVRILHGPFSGLRAKVVAVRADGLGDAVVHLEVNGQPTAALLPLAILSNL